MNPHSTLSNGNGTDSHHRPMTNGAHTKGKKVVLHPPQPAEPTLEELERQLPLVRDGQVPLALVIDRVVQDAYANLTEMADTMPGSLDRTRKEKIARYAGDTKKQVVKTYVVVKWAKVADDVQRAMNITQFLLNHNLQFDQAVRALTETKDLLNGARMPNYDILNAIDVFSTGSYQRLPSIIKKTFTPTLPLTNSKVRSLLTELEDVIRFRLRLHEIIPLEMQRYRIADGRAYFTVPSLFCASLSLTGCEPHDVWHIIHLDFLFHIKGKNAALVSAEFPTIPPLLIWGQIFPGVNTQLALNAKLPSELDESSKLLTNGTSGEPDSTEVKEEVVDAPLVRAFNLLQMLSLTYQLEILLFQASQMKPLGWAEFLNIEMSRDRRTLKVYYWVRKSPPAPRPANAPAVPPRPPHGGVLTISVVDWSSPTHVSKVARELEERGKISSAQPSDHVTEMKLTAKWEIASGALGVRLSKEVEAGEDVPIDANNLDFESLLLAAIDKHSTAILNVFHDTIMAASSPILSKSDISLIEDAGSRALRLKLCGDQFLLISIDTRTGRFHIRDAGDLAAWTRATKFLQYTEKLNSNPTEWLDSVITLRYQAILDLVETQAIYLGLQTSRNLIRQESELAKFGEGRKGCMFIKLAGFPSHYLVVLITEQGLKNALISVKKVEHPYYSSVVIDDLGWLNSSRIGLGPSSTEELNGPQGKKRKREEEVSLPIYRRGSENSDALMNGLPSDPDAIKNFAIDAEFLRKLYAFCVARKSHMKVEHQLKNRGISWTPIFPSHSAPQASDDVGEHDNSRPVPALWLRAKDVWKGVGSGADCALENVKIVVVDWWTEKQCRVVTTVKLKPAAAPITGEKSKLTTSSNITYDPKTSLISFVSSDIDNCVADFLEGWDRVERVLGIAREVNKLREENGWEDVRILSFDLQRVQFSYYSNYAIFIRWLPPPSTPPSDPSLRGSYDMTFSRVPPSLPAASAMVLDDDKKNPHQDAAPFFSSRLQDGLGNATAFGRSIRELVVLLRDTLPVLTALEQIRSVIMSSGGTSPKIEVLIKGASWYQILYASKHALDFRMKKGGQVIVLDGSYSLFSKGDVLPLGLLSPIPGFSALVDRAVGDVVKELREESKRDAGRKRSHSSVPPLVSVQQGVLCTGEVAPRLAKKLHDAIVESIRQ
ncbi:hypothetical protein BOTBODRAFT_31903 [Botryobasidium botryosum FD-172 SS1]|uniref:Mediator of RNA polymerase II transcription subunit 14 n=1 Tax=Botryobasidium botryosum (strain FD-172 SS1) TaxID=930990 RepID=A0A067MHI8_BOTB1|nr:hypothetical protein BOTBODRAFT_31903 [Botryobasidium botryosum FD-172 SS1]